jgi:predicted neutral ceramidase superfamily lipid hydrolase
MNKLLNPKCFWGDTLTAHLSVVVNRENTLILQKGVRAIPIALKNKLNYFELLVSMALDLLGNITLTLSVTSLFLLILGLPLVSSIKNSENLRRHGYLTIVALILETILVFVVMVPSFLRNINAILVLPFASS